MKKPTLSDLYDIDKRTGALILGKNRLEDYASKFLSKYCKEALETPMPLPVEEILEKAQLTVKEVSLSKNLDVFGCCLLLDGEVEVFNKEDGTYHSKFFPEGTILIDPESEAKYGEGARRNTLIHEALHWEKDKTYFNIIAIKNKVASERLYPIMCRQSETYFQPPEGKKTKDNEVRWLEWQAHRLAPRVLMPFNSFKNKALEITEEFESDSKESTLTCDLLIEILSEFFIVSRASVKHRLLEVGLSSEIEKMEDYHAVFDEIKNKKEYVPLALYEAFQLVNSDSSIVKWIKQGRFVFADGYFVVADSKFVMLSDDGFHLTAKAKKNLAACAINIHEHKYVEYDFIKQDLVGYAVLFRNEGIDKRLVTFHPKYQNNIQYEPEEVYSSFAEMIKSDDDQNREEFVRMLADPFTTLCQCLWYLMEKQHWIYPEAFADNTWLHKNYHGRIRNDQYNNMGSEVLMAICVGLKLTIRTTEKLFNKSKNKLDVLHNPEKTYLKIIEALPGLSMQDFNAICEQANIQPLGSKINW